MNTSGSYEKESSVPVETQQMTVSRWRALRRLWRAELIYLGALAAFAVLAIFAHLNPYFGWDLLISERFNWKNFAPAGLFPFMEFVSVFGNRWIPYLLAGVTAIAFLLLRRRSEAAGLIFSTAGSALINSLFKLLIARPRPASNLIPIYRDLATQSFPSGHVTFYVSYFGFLFFTAYALLPRGTMARRVALALTGAPVLLVGLSRVYLGAHWPSDTIGAYLWSGVWLAFSLWMYRRWKLKRTFHKGELAPSGGQ
ncbi:MAG TPA: phosphatase PAP2 family protein [Pyrinomonadaceae bacterium]